MRYFLSVLFALAIALGLGGAGTVGQPVARAAGAPAAAGKLYGSLAGKAAAAAANDRFRVIVHLRDQVDVSKWPANDRPGAIRALHAVADRTQPAIRSFLAQSSPAVSIYQTYWIFNGLALEAPLATIQGLAARDDVAYVIEDGYLQAPTDPGPMTGLQTVPANASTNWNIYQVNAPQTWALGYDGTGRTVANQDTGVQGSHPALAARWRGIQPGHNAADSWLDPFGLSPTFPTASGAHGTHTMGTIAGYTGTMTGTGEIGQAKGANWIACRIYDATGKGPFSYMHACFQFMTDPDGNPNTNDQPDAVGNSWGDTSSEAYSFPDTEWWPDIAAWRAAGIMPVFANANSGPGAGTVNVPGSYPISIGVGAVDINRNIAGFSSRGPAPNLPPWTDQNNWERSDWNLVKPEVVAPGVSVYSSVPTDTYAVFSGTSMATPHVAGLAGILRQIRPDLTVNEFYNIIIDTAYFTPTWGTRPNNNYGWGEIDDYAAAVYVRDAGAISGTITDASCTTAVSGVDVRVYDNSPNSRDPGAGIRKLVSDNTGHYRTILAAGQYTVTVSAPGYYGMSYSTSVMSSTTSTLPIMLTKMATGVVSGVVLDSNPYAVAGATVSVAGLPNLSTTTNAQGQYTLSSVPAGTFTIRAEKTGYTGDHANVQVIYPNTTTQNFTLGAPTVLLGDDFESGNLNNWTVTGGTTSTAIWNNSTVRAMSGTHAARAGIPGQPMYTGAANTYMTSATSYDTSAADRVWLSFNLYDSAESEYDILRVQVSSNGGTTWTAVYGEASPVHGWQAIALDVTNWKSATMMVRFYFHSDGSNWNNEVFEGPSVDDVVFSASGPAATATATWVPALTPTPGSPVPCTPIPPTATQPAATATATPRPPTATNTPGPSPTACTVSFSDVHPADYFYPPVLYLACHGVISGYGDGTFRPYAQTTRAQMVKIVVLGFAIPFYTPPGGQYTFADVPPTHPFFVYVETAVHRAIVSGYACGGPTDPCIPPQNRPYFHPGANVTRAQLAKIDVVAAGWALQHPASGTFEDVAPGNPFYPFVETAAAHTVISGYACGGQGEPCDPQRRPYYRQFNPATRGQIAKIVYLSITAGP